MMTNIDMMNEYMKDQSVRIYSKTSLTKYIDLYIIGRMNRQIDFDSLKTENFQLKNQITDLKNGFDLNKDVLKILEEQCKESNPKNHIFYQIISRLTGINNQLMLSNVQLIQDKNKLTNENKKMQNTINNLSQRLDELLKSRDCVLPKEINMQMREEMKELRAQIYSYQEQCIRKNIQIQELKSIIKSKQHDELKKPIIPTVNLQRHQKIEKVRSNSNFEEKIRTSYEQKVGRKTGAQKNLQRQNAHLKRLVEELEYRLTLLCRIYEIEPERGRQSEYQQFYNRSRQQQSNPRKLNQFQLNLLMFALNNTTLQEDQQIEQTRLTITKRMKRIFDEEKQKETKRSTSK